LTQGKDVKLKLKKMKKVILIFLAAIAFSCGDGSNRSSQSGTESETEDNYSREPMESDTTDMQSDTTNTPGMDRGAQQSDTSSVNGNNR
jgi:hypothetical protein